MILAPGIEALLGLRHCPGGPLSLAWTGSLIGIGSDKVDLASSNIYQSGACAAPGQSTAARSNRNGGLIAEYRGVVIRQEDRRSHYGRRVKAHTPIQADREGDISSASHTALRKIRQEQVAKAIPRHAGIPIRPRDITGLWGVACGDQLREGTADAAFTVDAQSVTRSWNRAAEKLFGIPASDAIGQACAEMINGRGALEDLVCDQHCQVLQCVATGREIPNFDISVKTRTGQDKWVNVSILRFHDSRTRRSLAVHFMRDITAQKRTEELERELLDVAKGLVALSTDPTAPLAPISPLTKQEQKLLRSLATGRSPAEVASELSISERTLRNHLYHVNRKLGTRNRLQAVIHAERHGLI